MRYGGDSAFPRSAAAVTALYRAGAGCSDVIRKGSQYVAKFPAGDEKQFYLYGQYFAAQVMSHANQADWDRWSAAVRDRLLGQQREDGSWIDPLSVDFGTAEACLTLQTWRLVAAEPQEGKPSAQYSPVDKSKDEQAKRKSAAQSESGSFQRKGMTR
jgi:hypothetical protein